jgi:glycosyltransferase involved in cell wall biosynthesis
MTNQPTLQCIVPARNEAGHLASLIEDILSVPEISRVVIVEGGSTDNTYQLAADLALKNQSRITCLRQSGKGKFNAVLEGAIHHKADFTMVWDADGTVPLGSTRNIINHSLATGNFVMGDRLRGKIEPGAMQFANIIGNWIFAILWAPITKIRPTDIFCGTKIGPTSVFLSAPKHLVASDPYGDISLLLSSRLLNIPISAVRVSYRARAYGVSNMRRWSMGLIFLKLTLISYALCLQGSEIKKLIN